MKISEIVLLGLSLLLILAVTGCGISSPQDSLESGDTGTGQADPQLDGSEDKEILDNVDDELIDENDFVEIGEMI